MLTHDLGHSFQLVTPGFNIKRYPAQITMQWPIEAVLTLQQKYHIPLEDIALLDVEIPAGRADRSQPEPGSGLAGKFSFEYCAAVALAEGRVDIETFSDTTRFSSRVEDALRLVRVHLNPDIPTDILRTWARARVRTKDGREFSETCQQYRGSIGNPMSREERLSKVRSCAQRLLRPPEVEQLITMVEELEALLCRNALA